MYCNPPNFNMHILRKVWEKLKQILHAKIYFPLKYGGVKKK